MKARRVIHRLTQDKEPKSAHCDASEQLERERGRMSVNIGRDRNNPAIYQRADSLTQLRAACAVRYHYILNKALWKVPDFFRSSVTGMDEATA